MAVIAVGNVYQQATNLAATEAAAGATIISRFFSSEFWSARFWFWGHPVNPKYVDFSLSYSLSEPLLNTVDGVEVLDSTIVLTANVNQSDADLLAELKDLLADYLTTFFGRTFLVEDIRGCSL